MAIDTKAYPEAAVVVCMTMTSAHWKTENCLPLAKMKILSSTSSNAYPQLVKLATAPIVASSDFWDLQCKNIQTLRFRLICFPRSTLLAKGEIVAHSYISSGDLVTFTQKKR